MGNQNPHNAPPALPPQYWYDARTPGIKHGIQSSEVWNAGDTDGRDICDQVLAQSLWRVSVFGSPNMRVTIQYGTSRAKEFVDLLCPVVLSVPGQLRVRVKPIDGAGGSAMVTCTPATSGGDANARRIVTVAGALPDDAARFRALVASVVTFPGPVACNLTATQWVPLVAGSVLTSGAGLLEFEP